MSTDTAQTIGLSLIACRTPQSFSELYMHGLGQLSWMPVFELSYKMDTAYIDEVLALQANIVSVHAPCPYTDILPNLGSRDPDVVQESLHIIKSSARTAALVHADVVVLHAGYATDSRIHTDFERRRTSLGAEVQASTFIANADAMVCSRSYTESSDYRMHLEQAVKNLADAVEICAREGVILAVENLNPRITYLMQRPEELLFVLHRLPRIRICLDIGHLWLSSIAHGFDFFQAVQMLSATGKVVTTHLHNNSSKPGDVMTIADDHHSINRGNIPYDRVLEMLHAGGVKRYIIEAKEQPSENLSALKKMLSCISCG